MSKKTKKQPPFPYYKFRDYRVRLAPISPNGSPLISVLCFLYEEGNFWYTAQEKMILRHNLFRNPRCAFEASLDTGRSKLLRGQSMLNLN
jgi:hypothetical protein